MLEKAVREFPQDGSARAALADAHLAMGDLDGAIAEAEKRLQLEPTAEARLELAALYAQAREREGRADYQAVLKEKPEDLAAALRLADLYLANRDYAATERCWAGPGTATPTTPGCSAGWARPRPPRRLGLALPELEQLVRAIRRSSKRRPSSAATSGRRLRHRAEAVASGRHRRPPGPARPTYLGQVLFERGQPAEAEKAFRASLSMDPTFGAPHFYLGRSTRPRTGSGRRSASTARPWRQSDLGAAKDAVKRLEAQVAADVPTGNAARPGR